VHKARRGWTSHQEFSFGDGAGGDGGEGDSFGSAGVVDVVSVVLLVLVLLVVPIVLVALVPISPGTPDVAAPPPAACLIYPSIARSRSIDAVGACVRRRWWLCVRASVGRWGWGGAPVMASADPRGGGWASGFEAGERDGLGAVRLDGAWRRWRDGDR
jgi:hypothetical protein